MNDTEKIINGCLDRETVSNYFKQLVNSFFKIIPLREAEDPAIVIYMTTLQRELLGCRELLEYLRHDPQYLSLLARLQWMIDNPDYRFREFRREVFGAISICNKLRARYAPEGGDAE